MVVRADLEVGMCLATVPAADFARLVRPHGAMPAAAGPFSQLREMTACAFRSSRGHVALISEEITLATYSSSGTSLTTVSPEGRRRMRRAPRKTCLSFRSQWKPMPIVTSSRAKAEETGSAGVRVVSDFEAAPPGRDPDAGQVGELPEQLGLDRREALHQADRDVQQRFSSRARTSRNWSW